MKEVFKAVYGEKPTVDCPTVAFLYLLKAL
ncbi:hypothetical protein EDC14_103447 [Hydrogenispora ethanolica]|uniref:Uncharacterized protein n=1 Tax=Hydrogenispora ethanolica TaxID=1082276 RepID=A0A4R1R795_HYDET|nr:hypothetical protein EDC14_103447 [Hydrogenispora ethanolica]